MCRSGNLYVTLFFSMKSEVAWPNLSKNVLWPFIFKKVLNGVNQLILTYEVCIAVENVDSKVISLKDFLNGTRYVCTLLNSIFRLFTNTIPTKFAYFTSSWTLNLDCFFRKQFKYFIYSLCSDIYLLYNLHVYLKV